MSKLYTMCGLPGSGKSTAAKQFDGIIISSDAIRKELYGDESIQGDGKQVFQILHNRVQKALAEGKNVIYDATNISAKRRKNIVRSFDAEHICVYIDIPIAECLHRNEKRERKVPVEVIKRMARNFKPPTEEEGFSKILKITIDK